MIPDDDDFDIFDLTDEELDALADRQTYGGDDAIEMKCINCGHEEGIPAFAYDEESEVMEEEGDTSLPAFQCPKCQKYTLYRKDRYTQLIQHHN